MNRRSFLLASTAASFLPGRAFAAPDAATAVETAHSELWRRFIDKHGIMIDFTDLDGTVDLPTPAECREGKPNALGWFQPIENGAMFNGLYMDAAVNRWKALKTDDAATKARRLMEGLLLLNSISEVKGFVGRGVSTDGTSHYPMGSNDQTLPWYVGLWRYWQSGLATPDEQKRITAKLIETTDVIVKSGWKMPAEPPFNFRGSFAGFTFDTGPRQLFVMKMMHAVTGDAKWDKMYRQALDERGGKENISKLEICQRGMVFDYAKTHNWTSCTAVSAIRGLWELETDAKLKDIYATGLKASLKLAAESLPEYAKFDAHDSTTFSIDWRTSMMPLWKPHTTEQEAQQMAQDQLREFNKISTRRNKETAFIREPASAAWIVTLCPDAELVKPHVDQIKKAIAHYEYPRLYYSTFFWVEATWWRLKAMGL